MCVYEKIRKSLDCAWYTVLCSNAAIANVCFVLLNIGCFWNEVVFDNEQLTVVSKRDHQSGWPRLPTCQVCIALLGRHIISRSLKQSRESRRTVRKTCSYCPIVEPWTIVLLCCDLIWHYWSNHMNHIMTNIMT